MPAVTTPSLWAAATIQTHVLKRAVAQREILGKRVSLSPNMELSQINNAVPDWYVHDMTFLSLTLRGEVFTRWLTRLIVLYLHRNYARRLLGLL